MSAGKRRYLFRIAVGVVVVLAVVWYVLRLQAIKARVQRRADWVRKAEAELKGLVQLPPPEPKALDAPPWRGSQVVRFQKGWAVGRVRTMHHDEDGGSLSGLGDITVLADDKGRTWYSQQHFCSGNLPGAKPGEEPGELDEKLSNADDIATYLAAFPIFHPQDGWTTNKSAVFDDSLWHPLSLP